MRFTLRQLEVFLAAARRENLTRAAGDLAMSQSAASGALRDLEDQYGLRLFERIGKRIRLSEAGHQLRPQAQSLLDQAAQLEASLAGKRPGGTVKLGATLTIGNYLAIEMIAGFRARHAPLDASLYVANTEEIVGRVLRYELDVGLIEGETAHPDLEVIPWRRDDLVVFTSPEGALQLPASLTDADLEALDWVVREKGSGTRQVFERGMRGLLSRLWITLELQHTEGIKRAVEAGLGVGCVSRIALADAFRRGSLVELKVPHRDFRRELQIVLRRDKYRGEALVSWLEFCAGRT